MDKIDSFYQSVRGKSVAFCGIGGSNLPLIRLFAACGARVSARDRREPEKLAETSRELEALGVRLILGENYLENLAEEIIFRTPGMPFHLPQLVTARAHGRAVTSEMEVFFDLCSCKIRAVTGSDGKTTTTTIISKLLEEAGKRVHLGGNIGTPLLPRVRDMCEKDDVVAELSSFQLISMRRSPDIAIVTNLSPNHLDIHKDMQEYQEAKKQILLHQNAFGCAVLNADNEPAAAFASDVRGRLLWFSRKRRVENGAWTAQDGTIYFTENGKDTLVMNAADIRIPGAHNLENYLAAICAVWGDVPVDVIRRVAKSFAGVEHRNELVREHNGVRWYNDSIGTTPSRTMRGTLSLFEQKLILIAGGYDKKIPFDTFGPIVCDKVKTLVLLGDTADKIENAVKNSSQYNEGNPKILRASSLEEAVRLCGEEAKTGDIVSLSPACASFDMFPNYETRGEMFRELVNKLP